MITHWPSPAKLNLFLYITGQRPDGYHTLQTLFQFIDYSDTISIELRSDGKICLLTPIDGLKAEDNLVMKAANLLMKNSMSSNHLLTNYGANIAVKKRLPINGGLGGGSSNAATVLVALNQLWNCGLSQCELAALGLRLSADIPIFVHGHAAIACGIGEILTPVELKEKWYLVIHPRIKVPTSVIFKDRELLRNYPIQPTDLLLKSKFSNNCEAVVRKRFREVDAAFSWLLEYAPARLTGTGACIFAEFDTECAAFQVLKQLPKWLYGFIARGMNTSPLYLSIKSITNSCNSNEH